MLVHVRRRRPVFDASALQRDVDALFRAAGFDRPAAAAVHAPLTAHRDVDGVTVRAELPGVDPGAIAVTVEAGALTIRAERPAEQRQNGTYQLRERPCGTFSWAVRLADDLDADAVSAEAKHGVLTVRIPKRAEAKPRHIPVTAS